MSLRKGDTLDTPELDHKTFDLAAALSGRTFPEDTFPVWFDEKSAYELVKANREIDQAVALKDEEAEASSRKIRSRCGLTRSQRTNW